MARPQAVPPQETASNGHRTLACPIFVVPIGEAQCIEQTRLPRRNAEKCAAICCTSPYRRCRICVSQGAWQGKGTLVIDPGTGLCAFHAAHGENARQSQRKEEVVSLETTPSIGREAKEREVVEAGRLVMIPLELVSPNLEQPRKHFDKEALEDLAASISDIGQLEAITVRAVKDAPRHKFEIVNGERRWRACRIARIEKIRAVVINIEDAEHQFEVAAASNFSREGHTELEEADAIQRIMERRNREPWQVARAFGKSTQWVTDRLKLLKLHPNVKMLMDPNRKGRDRLGAGVAKYLVGLPEDLQIELANTIVTERLKSGQAMHLIRRRAHEEGAKPGTSKNKRKPADDYRNFLLYLKNMEEGADRILENPDHLLTEMYRFRSPSQLDDAVRQVDGIVERLGRVRAALERTRTRQSM